MDKQAVYKQIRKTVDAYIPGTRILLFGSQARGDVDRFSDYDLLIITNENFSSKEKITWATRLNKALVQAINAPVDLLINSKDEVLQKKQLPGHIIGSALKEGVAL